MGKDVIIACDFKSKEETVGFLSVFGDERPFLKIGMELFYAEGPAICRDLKERGHALFLDLKVHDIPNTVKRTMVVLARLGVDMVNVHAAGSRAMMEAAREGLAEGSKEDGYGKICSPLLIAVTQLTSINQKSLNEELLIPGPMEDAVAAYARRAREAGLDGVVCSAREAGAVHDLCGKSFLTVTPGIRFAEEEKGDQKRVMTPKEAGAAGADYIVVGRSICGAKNPRLAYHRCLEDFLG